MVQVRDETVEGSTPVNTGRCTLVNKDAGTNTRTKAAESFSRYAAGTLHGERSKRRVSQIVGRQDGMSCAGVRCMQRKFCYARDVNYQVMSACVYIRDTYECVRWLETSMSQTRAADLESSLFRGIGRSSKRTVGPYSTDDTTSRIIVLQPMIVRVVICTTKFWRCTANSARGTRSRTSIGQI